MNNLPETFGSMAFGKTAMKERLPKEIYSSVERTIEHGVPLETEAANIVANAMKDWATSKGVTHFTHWFQPMTGVTAEKHDSFLSVNGNGGVTMEFSGKELIKGESDASSFPSGGLRSTFEGRGYTAWDPTSYAFIKDGALCIPTAFCSYGGEALDMRTPLLRSMDALNTQALRLLTLFGFTCERVYPAVGAEQEYFLIDRDIYNQRKDLIYTGRTLIGAKPPKGQELDDHYFGSIKIRVSAFMKELNEELWKLGVPAKAEHNEAAPAQHEFTSVFTTANLSTDHNQITMEIMRKVAKRHSLTCLLHEKPFEGVNGSGKHNNWSLSTNTGVNLLEPGDTPEENAQFLTILCAVISAVDDYQDLLRISVAGAGNDHRLGMSEAPPAIVSMFVGDELRGILDALENGRAYDRAENKPLTIGVHTLPDIPRDVTDRNRTSPFAFTGNKFEFRMPGSSMSIAGPNTVINTIVADALRQFCDVLEKAPDFNSALGELIRDTIKKHRRIIFDGNGYEDDWVAEAERRGLNNYRSTADALPHLLDEKNVRLFESMGVYSEKELRSRRDIQLENYCKQINIEALVMIEMTRREILPAVIAFSKLLADAVTSKRIVNPKIPRKAESKLLERVSELCDLLLDRCEELEDAIESANRFTAQQLVERAAYSHDMVLARMGELRAVADELETMVGKEYWPYPSYGRLLYRV